MTKLFFAKFAIDGSNISSRMKPFAKALVNFAYVNVRNDTSLLMPSGVIASLN